LLRSEEAFVPRVIWWSEGGWLFLMSKVPL